MLKKLIVIGLGLILVGGIVGCSGGHSDEPTNTDNAPVTPVEVPDGFEAIPVDALNGMEVVSGGVSAKIEKLTSTSVAVTSELGSAVYVLSLTSYNEATDAVYQELKTESITVMGVTNTCITEFRYKNLRLTCSKPLEAYFGHGLMVTVLENL